MEDKKLIQRKRPPAKQNTDGLPTDVATMAYTALDSNRIKSIHIDAKNGVVDIEYSDFALLTNPWIIVIILAVISAFIIGV